MTWHFEANENLLTVWDHEGTLVAQDRLFGTNPAGDNGVWEGDFPAEVLVVMRESFENGGPTSYNQALLRDAATENIERGAP